MAKRTRFAKRQAPRRGLFITFEGGEGGGKSTHVKRLLAHLQALDLPAIATREPGGSPKAEEIRQVILSGAAAPLGPAAEALLFAAARIDHLDQTIRPALTRGDVVVCDRFADSTRAYQGALGNLDKRFMDGLERITIGDTGPDLTLILDLPATEGLARATARRGDAAVDRFEGENEAFHTALRQCFLDIAAAEPGRCVVIDATRTRDEVEAAIWDAVKPRLVKARLLPSEPTVRKKAGAVDGAKTVSRNAP
ncbi:MAG TPA: dTMP kinase [Beijerinckiaceae bacterium]|jgi:dTMP kinase|nr:dTMP kinase [Beijerinckiaceae bacterium]